MKPRPLQNAVYWLSKDGFLQCETRPFTLHFVTFWKKALVYGGIWACSYEAVESTFLRNECSGVRLF